jgi:hypothetical protein
MNFRIIGGDGRQYGPIPEEQLRRWIAEGRANAQTQIQPEGAPEWKPLSSFPELAPLTPVAAPAPTLPTAAPADGRDAAARAVVGPAVGLIVAAALGAIWGLVGILALITQMAGLHSTVRSNGDDEAALIGTGIICLLSIPLSVVMIVGGVRLLKLRSRGLALTAAIIALIPCVWNCCVLGLPFGIWALVVMNRPEVKMHFE